MDSISIKKILKLLDYPTIKIKEREEEAGELNRTIIFETFTGAVFEIDWWINQCYLILKKHNIKICFNDIERNNFWPNGNKMDLQFKSGNGDVVCILGIEEWSK